jgi:hypothetical protein
MTNRHQVVVIQKDGQQTWAVNVLLLLPFFCPVQVKAALSE